MHPPHMRTQEEHRTGEGGKGKHTEKRGGEQTWQGRGEDLGANGAAAGSFGAALADNLSTLHDAGRCGRVTCGCPLPVILFQRVSGCVV